MVEPLLDNYVAEYKIWADNYISRTKRTLIAIVVSLFCVILACFFAFQDEYNAASLDAAQVTNYKTQFSKTQEDLESLQSNFDALQARLPQIYSENQNVKNSAIANDLANFVMSGTDIGNTFAVGDDPLLMEKQYLAWDSSVRLYLEKNLGASYLAPYESAVGGPDMLTGHSIDGDGWYALLQSKMIVLNGFIAKFQP